MRHCGSPRNLALVNYAALIYQGVRALGKEAVKLSTAEGKMGLELSNNEGIKLVNKVGGISIKCRKLTIKAKNIYIKSKKLTIKAGSITEEVGTTKIKAGGDITFKAPVVKLHARQITAGGRQIAKATDPVMGFDIHRMVIPSGKGTSVVPLPHPFIGKLMDRLSPDVKIKGLAAAVKGTIAKHNHPVHHQLPGTIRFQKSPSKQGEVTGGTVDSVLINGKPVAVVGSTVSTCNDIGAKDNSKILAPGTHMPMPDIIHPKNTAEWLEEQEAKKTRHPEIVDVQIAATRVKEGEKIKVIVRVKDIADGNPLTLQIWLQGQNPDADKTQGRKTGEIKNGEVSFEFDYTHPKWKEFPAQDPVFFFTVHSAWCKYATSREVTVELRRPEMSRFAWAKKKDASETNTSTVGETLLLTAHCNEYMPDGTVVDFQVFREGANLLRDKPEKKLQETVKDGKVQVAWKYRYKHDPDNPLTEKPKFFFTADSERCKQGKSELVEIGAKIDIIILDEDGKTFGNLPFEITIAGKTEKAQTDENGFFQKDSCVPGQMTIEEIIIDETSKRPKPQDYAGSTTITLPLSKNRTKPVIANNWEKAVLKMTLVSGESSA
jgi:uncharacterized Zn-binding protein involved in type VI secretion